MTTWRARSVGAHGAEKPARGGDFKNKTFRFRRSVAEGAERRAQDERRSLNDVLADYLERYADGRDVSFGEGVKAIVERARAKRGGRALARGRPFTRDELYDR